MRRSWRAVIVLATSRRCGFPTPHTKRCAIWCEREDAKQDQNRARHRLSKFLLRHGRRPPEDVKKSWTQKYLTWIKEQVHFDQPALEATLLDYVHEVDHMAERIERLEKAIDVAIEKAPPEMRAVIEALQALRGVAKITAVSIVAEVGSLSRFEKPRQLMGYSGLVSSEFSSGNRGPALYASQQRLLLDRFQRVILMLDGDAAGRRATAQITARLLPHCSVQANHLASDTQPDQLTSDEVWRLLRATLHHPPTNACPIQ